MRRDVLVLVLAVAPPAAADTRVLVATDTYIASDPSYTIDDAADVALSVHIEWRDPLRQVVFDLVDRESLIGSAPRRELHELAYIDRSLDHLMFEIGRFRVPGGFWLMADGAELAYHADDVELGVFGGNRSFTNARVDTLLNANPSPIPLVGAALTRRGDVQLALAYTYTGDRVETYRGLDMVLSTSLPEQFIDAEVIAEIGAHGYLIAGATVGSQYLVTYPTAPANIADDPNLQNVWFGSQSAYGSVDWRLGNWRLNDVVAVMATKLGQVSDPTAVAAVTGSFFEDTARVTWREAPWRFDARYRARFWVDGGTAQRAQLTAEYRRDWFVAAAMLGVDVHLDGEASPGFADSKSLLYKASVGRRTQTTDTAIGVAAVSAIGDEVSVLGSDPNDQRSPYTLEARSYAFVQAFATLGGWFGGFDGELDLSGAGFRLLAQFGYAR